jgi:hypothetical protein
VEDLGPYDSPLHPIHGYEHGIAIARRQPAAVFMSLIEALDVWFSTKYFLYTFFMLPSMAHGTYRRREARMRRKDTIIYKCIGVKDYYLRHNGGGCRDTPGCILS